MRAWSVMSDDRWSENYNIIIFYYEKKSNKNIHIISFLLLLSKKCYIELIYTIGS